MCRNITTLRGLEPPATSQEIEAASRQFVRKVSGITRPSAAVEERFEAAAGTRPDGWICAASDAVEELPW